MQCLPTDNTMSSFKKIIKGLAPYGLVQYRQEQVQKGILKEREKYHEDRQRIIKNASSSQSEKLIRGDNREEVFAFLQGRQLERDHLQVGSIPESSLGYIRDQAVALLDSGRPLVALHVGNFVGVSLAFLATALKDRHPNSIVVSIDPNLTHRGISNPQSHVSALMTACGLQQNVMIIAGYSGKKSISNDGVVIADYDPQKEFANEFACEDSLLNLKTLCPRTFDLVMIDGNHEGSYLTDEIQTVLPLMSPGGVLVLDDVDVTDWAEIADVFSNIEKLGLRAVGTDGRIGVAQLSKETAP